MAGTLDSITCIMAREQAHVIFADSPSLAQSIESALTPQENLSDCQRCRLEPRRTLGLAAATRTSLLFLKSTAAI